MDEVGPRDGREHVVIAGKDAIVIVHRPDHHPDLSQEIVSRLMKLRGRFMVRLTYATDDGKRQVRIERLSDGGSWAFAVGHSDELWPLLAEEGMRRVCSVPAQ